ncbi:elongator complex protein 6-like [Athalia rosae]|uniref:elongator complex protein 6-like n=1 Tax=Athalia rosae TaxID=37344 RepID=UPI0006258E5B|nr:elongator complex protein 6-like [Athalia rosae]XP_012256511.1 elongator complex protein 6-like [Athalia rosae]XP_012256512.1 elongator complex protein 6-like [Athalia rosae]XP_048508045.1 elongator complex protein 6-like [Athalia rosae]
MTDSVCSALGIDRVDMCGKTVLIEEQHGSDANFLVNAIVSGALEKGQGICLVLFHNTFGHYHNVGMKLGYNMKVLRERGQVTVVEPMKIAASNVEDLGHDSIDAANVDLTKSHGKKVPAEEIGVPDIMKLDTTLVRQLFLPVRNKVYEMLESIGSVNIIVDDLSHLFDMSLSLKDVWFYVRYLRSLMEFEPMIAVCIMTHTYRADPNTCQPDMIAIGLKHMSDLIVSVEPLSTGHANDVSGKINIRWNADEVRKKYHWADKTTYLYKLLDRQVKMFAPGASTLC